MPNLWAAVREKDKAMQANQNPRNQQQRITQASSCNKQIGRFSIPSTRTTYSRTWKFVHGKSGLQVNTSEDGSTHLQLEQQRTR
jgi:hypothetical protein